MKQLLFGVFIGLFCFSCDYVSLLGKEGDIEERRNDVQDYHSLVLEAPYHLVFVNDTASYLRFEGMDFLMEGIVLKQTGNTLTLDHDLGNYMQRSKMLTVYLHSPKFSRVTLNRSCILSSKDTLAVDDFVIVVNGGGKFSETDMVLCGDDLRFFNYGSNNVGNHSFSGFIRTSLFVLEGSVNLYAKNLVSSEVHVVHKSIGDCYVHADDQLQVEIYSTGNTYFCGEPTIESERLTSSFLKAKGKIQKVD